VPLPGGVDALVILLAAGSPRQAFGIAAMAVAGSAVGSLVLFYLARRGGQMYLERHTVSRRGRRMMGWFHHYGLLTVFIPALLPIPMPLKIFVIAAGALGISPGAYMAVILLARIPRYGALAYLGVKLGEDSKGFLREHAWDMVIIAVVLFALLYALVKVRDRLKRAASQATG
jgi:membrane protein YqaA with SNARE-associated domain